MHVRRYWARQEHGTQDFWEIYWKWVSNPVWKLQTELYILFLILWFLVYGRGEDDILSWHNSMLDDTDNLIMKTENMSDEECLDDDQYTDSDIE